jgi:soluble lytic murein transglycosylase-like protein
VVLVGFVLAVLLLGMQPVATLAAAPGQSETRLAQARIESPATHPSASPIQAGGISAVFQPAVQYWGTAIQNWATAQGLDPNLVATVMQIESCGDPRALSRAGAIGLFQVMPFHFTDTDNPYNPDTNAARGLAYLNRSMEKAAGDKRLAFAGYNGGIDVIGRSESSWAAETQRYAYWGSGIYAEASSGAAESLRLQEWLAAGGASLCRQASSRLGIN